MSVSVSSFHVTSCQYQQDEAAQRKHTPTTVHPENLSTFTVIQKDANVDVFELLKFKNKYDRVRSVTSINSKKYDKCISRFETN